MSLLVWTVVCIGIYIHFNNEFHKQFQPILIENLQLKQYNRILQETIEKKSKTTTIMVVLGCAMPELQQDRIQQALEFAEKKTDEPIIWFLTGGVKNALTEQQQQPTEAETMAKSFNNENVVLDEKARNTAENFANLKKWITSEYINTDKGILPEVVITTSEFHQKRAAMIFDGIFQDLGKDIKLTWNVSGGACATCWADENIHMRNVKADVMRALVQ